tara:strand:+ start:2468 stop:2905 length:438 start_codon:yes stop_codon:yes gene_type:complete
MKKENEDKLKAAFPQIFTDLQDCTAMESCMAWGVAVGEGWYDLIYNLCEQIMALDPPKDFKAAQVKEKFGGLRFYTSGHGSKEIFALIDEAERRSYTICEDCGSEENVSCDGRPSWVTTLCNSCAEALKKRQEEKRLEREKKSGG